MLFGNRHVEHVSIKKLFQQQGLQTPLLLGPYKDKFYDVCPSHVYVFSRIDHFLVILDSCVYAITKLYGYY